ncbi:MAG TPA: tRNA (adenosine(37)-N6)-threonylcarbamoyltransferase complex dimerization subunit type 1 TsaB [Gemmatimonadaceae bacterium]|nr:tRNA (adenosine(37)-N6)-threonylcarbamoyltransferase complex dimerization subunit type 1 TsaB [Gemmatimonadaceae bacterium]
MITLAIDASTYAGDVAVLDGANVLAESRAEMKGADRERLMPAVAATLDRAGVTVGALDRVVCGAGPGSFTSLRIAAGIAKGVALGAGAPLYGISSLALLVGGAELGAGTYLAALDALRGEFYLALYSIDAAGIPSQLEPARLGAGSEVERIAGDWRARIVSPTHFEGSIVGAPRASAVALFSRFIAEAAAVDLDSWEPSYGRLAEAQVRWEAAHGRPLAAG